MAFPGADPMPALSVLLSALLGHDDRRFRKNFPRGDTANEGYSGLPGLSTKIGRSFDAGSSRCPAADRRGDTSRNARRSSLAPVFLSADRLAKRRIPAVYSADAGPGVPRQPPPLLRRKPRSPVGRVRADPTQRPADDLVPLEVSSGPLSLSGPAVRRTASTRAAARPEKFGATRSAPSTSAVVMVNSRASSRGSRLPGRATKSLSQLREMNMVYPNSRP